MIKVLLVDDSAIVRAMVSQVMENDGRFCLVGTAENGSKAITQNEILKPDLIVMDINMPIMDGIEASKRILEKSHPAIIAYTTEDSADIAFKCLEAGALEVIKKPNLSLMSSEEIKKFCDRLAVIAEKHTAGQASSSKKIQVKKSSVKTETETERKKDDYDILFIGASTGGPSAIQTVLKGLGENFPLPILVTQHIDTGFDLQFTKWLSATTDLPVSLAENGIRPKAGHVYVAAADHHLVLQRRRGSDEFTLLLNDDPPLHFLKPAVDKMFVSAALCCKNRALALLLTGMGRDGADGCLAIKREGGFTICQSEKTCVVYGMPRAAVECGAASLVADLEQIADLIKGKVR